MRIRIEPRSCIKGFAPRSKRRDTFIKFWVPSVAVVKRKKRRRRTALIWVIMRRVLTISYRRFGTIYHSHLQGSRILGSFLNSWHLKMGLIGCPESSARNCQYSLLNNPKASSSHRIPRWKPEITLKAGNLREKSDNYVSSNCLYHYVNIAPISIQIKTVLLGNKVIAN